MRGPQCDRDRVLPGLDWGHRARAGLGHDVLRSGRGAAAGAVTAAHQNCAAPDVPELAGHGLGAQQFTPLLLVYRSALALGTGTVEAMFGLYAAAGDGIALTAVTAMLSAFAGQSARAR